MFRYLLLKLPSFTSKADFPVPPPCTKSSLVRPVSPSKREYRREPQRSVEIQKPQKRSYSFPCTRTRDSNLLDSEPKYGKWDSCSLPKSQGSQRKQMHQSNKYIKAETKKVNSRNSQQNKDYFTNDSKRLEGEKLNAYKQMNKSKQFGHSFDGTERYELEAARPRRHHSEIMFNVFDHVTDNSNDPVRYLQPNKLKPFGSHDNICLPLLLTTTTMEPNAELQNDIEQIPKRSDNLKNNQKTDESQQRHYSTMNKKEYFSEDVNSNNDIQKYEELNPIYISKKLSPKFDNKEVAEAKGLPGNLTRNISGQISTTNNKTLEETLIGKTTRETTEDVFHSYRISWNEPKIKIEPAPFLPVEDTNTDAPPVELNRNPKKPPSESVRLHPPWPAYSERVKKYAQKCPSESALAKENLQPKVLLPQKRNLSTENITRSEVRGESKELCSQQEKFTNDFSQKRSLSSEKGKTHKIEHELLRDASKRSRSTTAVPSTKNATSNLTSVSANDLNENFKKNYARSSKTIPYEPESCAKKEKTKKYFLPSKVRLSPPECVQKPLYRGCIQEDPCPPRADEGLKDHPKKLPVLKPSTCPCVEPYVPTKDPTMRRLKFKFEDPPKICPCDPCPCPPRADDSVTPKPKKLSPYVPGYCACVEPPPMIEVPLVKLKKVCEPEDRCYPPKECPTEEPCERADDHLVECHKKLPRLKKSDCPCVEPYVPNVNPRLQRLKKIVYKDPPRECPCEPNCPCPPRADDSLVEKPRRLPVYKPGNCDCVEPPPMIDVPLKRLEKVCTPEVCDPQKYCPVETCEDRPRADDFLKEKHKKLPVLKVSNCKCIEPEVPDKLPKMRRLRMKFTDEPRVCPCEPNCPCPPRADDTLVPKAKKLLPYVPGNCACVEPPLQIDVPLIRLKKVCEPEAKCYPTPECPKEIPCEEKPRADDNLCLSPKKLPFLEPKHCPCVENPKMKDAPRLKRLTLKVPEPLRVCPEPEPCIRSDDTLKEKIRKLPFIKPGPCPCVSPKSPEDVKPLRRLKCEEEEPELVTEDPCVPYPRADWGCWEYLQSIEPESEKKCKKDKKRVKVNIDTKRKYNTDSRVNSLKMANTTNERCGERSSSRKNSQRDPKLNSLDTHKTKKQKTTENIEVGRSVRLSERYTKKPSDLKKSSSFPTVQLLKQLNDLEQKPNVGSKNSEINEFRIMDIKSVLNKISSRANVKNKALLSTNARKLCTSASRHTESVKRQVSSSNILLFPGKKSSKDCADKTKDTPKKHACTKSKCPTMILKGCGQKSLKGCEKERTPVCCEKKPSPYPAFSEAMNEEIEPYSKTTQWTCNRRQYGFDPNPKKFDEPLDTVRNKKKFSTVAPSLQNSQHSGLHNIRGSRKDFCERPKTSPVINYNASPRASNKNGSVSQTRFSRTPQMHKNFQLLNQNINPGIIGVSCATLPRRGYSTLQPHNSTSIYPLTTTDVPQNIVNLNTFTSPATNLNKASLECECPNQFRRSESSFGNKKSNCGKKASCKKERCPKAQLNNCPPKQRETCKTSHPVICQKPRAPYPAFSDNMDEQMQDNFAECPLARERILRLQPKHTNATPNVPSLEPVQPHQGKIDMMVEETCIRRKLCMKNDGLSQDCSEFGKPVKPMRSKDYIKEKNRDCQKIEDLKKDKSCPPRNTRGFCVNSNSAFDIHKRRLSTTPSSSINNYTSNTNYEATPLGSFSARQLNESNHTITNSSVDIPKTPHIRTKRMYVRNYHVLCNNAERNVAEDVEKKNKEAFLKLFRDIDESYRCVKLRNVQWRVNNFQKWYRLNNQCNVSTTVKRFHTCSKIKYKRYVTRSPYSKTFSTSTVKSMSANEGTDFYTQRGISTTMMLAKARSEQCMTVGGRKPKFPFVSKCHKTTKKCPKFRLPNCPQRARETCEKKPVSRPCSKPVTPNPSFSECYDEEILNPSSECPLEREKMQRLQPKYPMLPEIGTTSSPPPHQGRIDPSLESDYIRLKLGLKNEGITQDCETFGQPIKSLKCRQYTKYEYSSKGKKDQCLMDRKKKDPCIIERNPCKAPKLQCPCPPKPEDTLWQKVVNYFKARPNCPAPDEWKKKALREKAEKAAKAAGLCLCEPKDLPKKICNNELPKVITPKDPCSGLSEDSDCDSCDDEGGTSARQPSYKKGGMSSRGRSRHGSGFRRCISTVPTRYYSSNMSWKNIEEINKSIEESEKNKNTRKMSDSFREDRNSINDNCNDDEVYHNVDTSYEDIFSEAILNKNEENDIEKYLELDDIDNPLNYALQIVPNEHNLVEIIFNEPSDEFGNYGQTKAFASFQDYFNNFDAFSEISYEDAERAKTNNLLKELDKLLEDNEETNKEN